MNDNHISFVSTGAERCPYLGLHDDSATALAYPSIWNYCYRPKQPGPVDLSHQSEVCLGPAFIDCPVYGASQLAALPANLKGSTPAHRLKASAPRRVVRALLFFLLLASVFTLVVVKKDSLLQVLPALSNPMVNGPGSIPAVHELTSDPASPAEAVPGPATVSLRDISPTASPASAQGLISTPAGVCGHMLDAPFGNEVKFVLHRVISGENLTMYAEQYHTSENAIMQINYRLPTPVWENWVVVIPVDIENVGDLPRFEPYQAVGITLSLNALARQLESDPQSMHEYNAFGEQCGYYSGWLLVPRDAPTPPQ